MERDLGLEEEATVLPNYFAATGSHPEWIAEGAIIRIRNTGADGWRASDVVSQVEWPVDDVPGEGFGAVIGLDNDRLRGVICVD